MIISNISLQVLAHILNIILISHVFYIFIFLQKFLESYDTFIVAAKVLESAILTFDYVQIVLLETSRRLLGFGKITNTSINNQIVLLLILKKLIMDDWFTDAESSISRFWKV